MLANQLAFVARNRSTWEIFELTQLFVKANYLSLMKITCLLYLPIAALLWLSFSPTIAGTLFWWIKPLLERAVLDYLSKRNFSQPTSTWQSIKSIKNLPFSQMLLNLTIYRLSPNRAYLSAVSQLERLEGTTKKKRESTLLMRYKHSQTFMTLFCVHLELLLTLSIIATIYALIPEGINIDEQFSQFDLENGILAQCYFFASVVSIIIITPYYVTGGFLTYLHSRIRLEAWDLELAFKKISARFNSLLLAVLLVFVSSVSHTSNTLAAVSEVDSVPVTEDLVEESARLLANRSEIEKIYQDQHLIETQKIWLPDKDKNPDKEDFNLKWLENLIEWAGDDSKLFSNIIMATLITFIAWLVFKVLSSVDFRNVRINKVSVNRKSVNELPTFISKNSIKEWPQDLLESAVVSLEKNDTRTALMYLLKHALELANQHVDVVIHPSMTEFECESALLEVLPDSFHTSYKLLFRLWVQQAWAHRDADIQQVKNLVDAFRRGFSKEAVS